jgi:ethanolamine utilization protein EutP (predicted NTPase)
VSFTTVCNHHGVKEERRKTQFNDRTCTGRGESRENAVWYACIVVLHDACMQALQSEASVCLL